MNSELGENELSVGGNGRITYYRARKIHKVCLELTIDFPLDLLHLSPPTSGHSKRPLSAVCLTLFPFRVHAPPA